jgi:uncharacterized membrane protein (UPF0127 family)
VSMPGLVRRSLIAAVVALLCMGTTHHRTVARPAQNHPQRVLRQEPMVIVTQRGPVRLMVEMATSESTRETGLMWRTNVPPFGGMLFDFNPPHPVAFWMHNTIIPLDMLFIDPSGRIISIARNARPRDDTPIASGGVVRGVLEIRGGRAAELGVLPGDRVQQRIFTSG